MTQIAKIVETIRCGGAFDATAVEALVAAPNTAPPTIENWQMNFAQGTLSELCEITSQQPIIGAGMLAYSADGKTYYFGTYCSMSDAKSQTTDTIALVTASTALFNPEVNGRNIMAVVYGEVQGADGKPIPFSQQQNFSV